MRRCVILSIAICAIWAAAVECTTFNRCSLARELKRLGAKRTNLPAWVCIAEHASNFRTEVIGPPHTDGSMDHGIFQINDRYWCKRIGRLSSNGCNIDCGSLRTHNIAEIFRCAQEVRREQGYDAWTVWNRYCNGRLPNLDHCF